MAKAGTICSLCCGCSGYVIKRIWSAKFVGGGGGGGGWIFSVTVKELPDIHNQQTDIIGSNCLKTFVLFLYVECNENGE